MNRLIDKATVICVGKMHWFGMIHNLVLYCRTAKWDWNEQAQARAPEICVGKMHWFGMFQNLLLYSQTIKLDFNEMAH